MTRTKWKKLSLHEISTGIDRCHENVQRLMKGALLSLSKGFYASAVMQAVLAIEEQGRKLALLEAYDGMEIDEEWWKIMFRSHASKISLTAMGYSVAKGQRKWARTIRRKGSRYQDLKERAMYVTFDLRRNCWVHPGSITKKMALAVLKETLSFLSTTDALMSD